MDDQNCLNCSRPTQGLRKNPSDTRYFWKAMTTPIIGR